MSNLFDLLGKESFVNTNFDSINNGPGPGKKKCNCGLYVGVRTKTCKSCGYEFSTSKKRELPPLVLPTPVYVYEHLRTDTWEKEQAERILAKRDSLNEKQNEFICVPSSWRPLCDTVEEVLERKGLPHSSNFTLKEDLSRIIVKCIKTDKFFHADNPRVGLLQQLIVVEVIDI